MIDIYRTSDSGEEKRQCLSAIGKAKDPALLSEAMDFILDSGEVKACCSCKLLLLPFVFCLRRDCAV